MVQKELLGTLSQCPSSPSSTICITNVAAGLELRVRNEKLIFLFLNQNLYCGYPKEPSQFEHPKHILKLMGKKIFTIIR